MNKDLCGDLIFVDKFATFANDNTVMTWTTPDNKWSADTADRNLIDKTRSYSLTVEFVEYSNTPSGVTSVGSITFVDPCEAAYVITGTTQTDPGMSDNFSG